jgi:hypothetical protein
MTRSCYLSRISGHTQENSESEPGLEKVLWDWGEILAERATICETERAEQEGDL